jgi:hypothetical protein
MTNAAGDERNAAVKRAARSAAITGAGILCRPQVRSKSMVSVLRLAKARSFVGKVLSQSRHLRLLKSFRSSTFVRTPASLNCIRRTEYAENPQNGGCCGSTELPVVAPERS